MKKIIINARFLSQKITGSQRFAIEISRRLKKIRSDIIFVAPKNIIYEDLAKELDIKIIGVNTGHIWEQIDLSLYLKKLGNPLLVNLVNTAPLFYRNKIVTIHDISWKHFPKSVSKNFYLYYNFLIPRIAKNSLHIFTVSEFSKKDIASNLNIDEHKIIVVYNAVAKHFRHLGLKNGNIILSVATLQPYKNMESLIRAFILLKDRYPEMRNYKLVLVGGINQRVFRQTEVRKLADNREDIIFTGYVSDEKLVKWYNMAQAFVLPSKFEGFGLPPLEAMACGCPVIVSNIASLPEVCGDAAYYVDPYDVDSIAKGIYKVLTDENLRQRLVQKGFERVKLFSWEKTAKQILEIFEKVLK